MPNIPGFIHQETEIRVHQELDYAGDDRDDIRLVRTTWSRQ